MRHKYIELIDNWILNNLNLENFTPGFERVERVFSIFKSQFNKRKIKIVTIGGTNGKGETAHSLNKMLLNDGKKVAMWTSPHILSICERFCFNGANISEEELYRLLQKSKNILSDENLSYYEFMFYVFCLAVTESENIDIVILEVGLGGRLDTVNVFDADISCLTSIARDHEAILGKGYKKILYEKLGIARKGRHLVSTINLKYLRNICEDYGINLGAKLIDLFDLGFVSNKNDYSERNRILASSVFEILKYEKFDKSLKKSVISRSSGIDNFTSIGRLETLKCGRHKFLFVGAHNLDGFRSLISLISNKRLNFKLPFDNLLVSFSNRPIKEIQHCLRLVASSDYWKSCYYTHFVHAKAADLSQVDNMSLANFSEVKNWKDFIKSLDNKEEITIVLGSYYFIGELQKYLREEIND